MAAPEAPESPSRLEPLDLSEIPGLEDIGRFYDGMFGFVPNGLRIMARRPDIVAGYIALRRAVVDPATSEVPPGLKELIGNIASKASGCRYCQAHTISAADRAGANAARLAALWDYQTSDLFSEAECAALDFAAAAASIPNGVTDEVFDRLEEHWDEGQIVEILAVVALYGFLNRWNDSLATELESPSFEAADRLLGSAGWEAGKHA